MKKSITTIALIVTSAASFSLSAAFNESENAAALNQISQGMSQVKNASAQNQITDGAKNIRAGLDRIGAITGGKYAGAVKTDSTTTAVAAVADTSATAHADYSGEAAAAQATAMQQQAIANYGVKTNPQGIPAQVVQSPKVKGQTLRSVVTREQAQMIQRAMVVDRYGAVAPQTINVSIATLKPETQVSVSINGLTQTVSAAELSTIAPAVQVAVPQTVSYFTGNIVKGGNNGHDHGKQTHGGSGNGQNNAAATNSAHGLGGGNHIGGGAAQSGSQSVGHW